MVPVPPVPATALTVRITPEGTDALDGIMMMTGAIGFATTVQLKTTGVEGLQPDPIVVR